MCINCYSDVFINISLYSTEWTDDLHTFKKGCGLSIPVCCYFKLPQTTSAVETANLMIYSMYRLHHQKMKTHLLFYIVILSQVLHILFQKTQGPPSSISYYCLTFSFQEDNTFCKTIFIPRNQHSHLPWIFSNKPCHSPGIPSGSTKQLAQCCFQNAMWIASKI